MSAAAATSYHALIPRDGLFCKDSRGWHTSASGRGHALDWPWPSTILGAVRTAWGRDQEKASSPFDAATWRNTTATIALHRTLVLRRPNKRGPSPAWSLSDRVWPAPADALWLEEKEKVLPLLPRRPMPRAVISNASLLRTSRLINVIAQVPDHHNLDQLCK